MTLVFLVKEVILQDRGGSCIICKTGITEISKNANFSSYTNPAAGDYSYALPVLKLVSVYQAVPEA